MCGYIPYQSEGVFAVRINYSALGFFTRNLRNYVLIKDILCPGVPWGGLAVEQQWFMANIPGPDHGFLNPNLELTEEQRKALLPILGAMGFFRAMDINPASYDEFEFTGGKFGSLVRATQYIRDRYFDPRDKAGQLKYKFGRIMCQYGQRPRTDAQDGTVEEIVSKLSANVLAHPWVVKELSKRHAGPYELFEGPFATEFELGILAFIVAYDGNIVVGEYVPSNDTTSLDGVPLRTVERCELALPNGTPVLVINCPAVKRSHGPARPTTKSSTAYCQTHYPSQTDGTRVANSRPTHGERVLCAYELEVHKVLPDVTVLGVCAPAPNPTVVLPNALGEAAFFLALAWKEHEAIR